MIIKINIFSPSDVCNLYLDESKNFVEYNGMEKTMDIKNYVQKFVQIFSSWSENYNEPLVFDMENFKVEVVENNKSKQICGCGNYPKNYHEFKSLIGEIISCF